MPARLGAHRSRVCRYNSRQMSRASLASVAFGLLPLTLCAADPTFWKDVQPVLQSRCVECHRPGEIGPMPLTSYKEARPWAASIKEAVKTRKMPPWFADPHFGKFSNDRSLSEAEIATLTTWAEKGAKEGDIKDAPPARKFNDGWNIDKPDLILQMPQPFKVAAKAKVDYQYIVLPTGFTEDKWVRMSETRPSDRAVVHHMVVFARDPRSQWLREAKPGVPFVPAEPGSLVNIGGGGNEIIAVYTPGIVPDIWKPNQARLIKAGSDLVLQVHYTSTGKDTEDQTKVGLVFAKEPPTERIFSTQVSNTRFVIPPGEANYEVKTATRFPNNVKLISFFPHMHLRGKDYEYKAVFPTGEQQILLKVPNYDFNWQLAYRPSPELELPAGTRIETIAHFDNSANNPANPDPKATVKFGEQSWEEMAIGFMDIAIPANVDPRVYLRPAPPAPPARPAAGQ
ncbi:MAG: hypothetical protein JWN34_4570 [Bryobacterales bacterium]|nr:hypothetical protein [Bryobacterales bacterium]